MCEISLYFTNLNSSCNSCGKSFCTATFPGPPWGRLHLGPAACSEIAILDHGQNDLLQRLAHVCAWRQQKLTKLMCLMHANAPITRLPNETLAFIFESVPQDAITISHVNRYW